MKQMRRQISEQLRNGQNENARIRVESVIRDKLLLQAYNILDLYLELFTVRSQLISKTKEIPRDLTEAVASVIYAARRISDVPELTDLAKMFAAKYGKEFAHEAGADAPTCNKWSVNANIVRCLLVEPPQGDEKLEMLTDIAQEYKVMFDAASMARELMVGPPAQGALVPPSPTEDPEIAAIASSQPIDDNSWAAEQDPQAAAQAAALAAQRAQQMMEHAAALAQRQGAYVPMAPVQPPPMGWMQQQMPAMPQPAAAAAGPSEDPQAWQPQLQAPPGLHQPQQQQAQPGYVVRSAEDIQRAYDAAVGPPQKGALAPPHTVPPGHPAAAAAPPSVPSNYPTTNAGDDKVPSAPVATNEEDEVFAALSRRLENLKSG